MLFAALLQELFDLPFQWRQVAPDRGPDNADIHIKVTVDHLVAHVGHIDPRHFGVSRHEFRRVYLNLAGRLADDLDIAYDSILIALALLEGSKPPKRSVYSVAR
ncbi:MAG TPA: hypothetical protein VJ770_08390 [Stellaceae bacterium]|nr:hypothetical protein [Stellaceae bacterium]